MATSADPTVFPQHSHPRTISSNLHQSTISASVSVQLTTTSIQTSPVAASLSDSFEGLEIDRSAASNTTTQSPGPHIALQLPTFQDLPPLPIALQDATLVQEECAEGIMGAEAKPNYVSSSGPSKSDNLRNSIGHLKQEMKNLRNADLMLLSKLNDLHQQILNYKVAISERLERQSETNSEYSNSFAEDYDFEDIEEDDDDGVDEEEEGEKETSCGQMHLSNGQIAFGGFDRAVNGVTQHQLQIQQQTPNGSLHQSPRPSQQHSQLASAQSPSAQRNRQHNRPTNHPVPFAAIIASTAPTLHPPPLSSAASRSSLQQLRQQLPPPPPRPAQEGRQGPGHDAGNVRREASGNDDGDGVHHWLNLNFQPDSYNC